MINNYLYRPRRKAWLGAAIGAAVGIGSAIFGASKQKQAQQRQYALQRAAENRNVGVTSASNLTQAYSNANEIDKEFRNRFFLYGGRKKAKWGAEDTTALINSLGSAGSNIANVMVGQAQQSSVYPTAIKPLINAKDNETVYDSAARNDMLNNYYRTAMFRNGGCRRK